MRMADPSAYPEDSALSPPIEALAPEGGMAVHGENAFSETGGQNASFPVAESAGDAAPSGTGIQLRGVGHAFAALPPLPDDPDIVALRRLLFQREIALLEMLAGRLADPGLHARDVSDVVAEALLLRSHKDDKLVRVLEPLVENNLKNALVKKRFAFATALFPIIGPAIRRSIAETFRSMLGSLNKSVEMSLSWQGLRWRIDSWRTGKPFSEVVLLHTLVYRVEQIFFIHGSTGLVLAHVEHEGVASQDADMISAMLTAIQDFVRDCFSGDRDGSLEQLQFGEFTILVEKNPLAYLACVMRGTPPVEFRQKLRSSLELLLVEYVDILTDYNGDNAPFASAHRLLEDCLESHVAGKDKPLPLWVKVLPVLILIGLAVGIGQQIYRGRLADEAAVAAAAHVRQERGAVVARLRTEPGIQVLNVSSGNGGPWELACLRDELARPVSLVIEEAGGQVGDFRVSESPYIDFTPEIILLRAQRTLHPPASVRMAYEGNGVLSVAGTAQLPWILNVRQAALSVPGISSLVFKNLTDPRLEDLLALVRAVESSVVEFPLGKDLPAPADLPKLEKTVNTLTALESLADAMGIAVSLTVYGYTDDSGNDKRNFELSQARARTLAAMLYGRGSHLRIGVYGMTTERARLLRHGQPADVPARRIELRIRLSTRVQDVFEKLQMD